jgi:hypothetical protein
MAILLVYLSSFYVEKKPRYKRLNMDNATAKLVMRHLHKFHHIERFGVRNSLSIEEETIQLYEYFRIYNTDQAECFGGMFVFLGPTVIGFYTVVVTLPLFVW